MSVLNNGSVGRSDHHMSNFIQGDRRGFSYLQREKMVKMVEPNISIG